MLQKLEEIHWSRLDDANGQATSVPGYLRAVTAPSVDQWVPALEDLRESVDQGIVYGVTPVVVPFLLEIAQDAHVSARHRILELLGDIAEAANHWSATDQRPWPMSDQDYADWQSSSVRDTQRKLWAGVDTLAAALGAMSPRVRVCAAYALGMLAGDPHVEQARLERVGDWLVERQAKETSPLVRASVAFALGRAARRVGTATAHLRFAATNDPADVVRLSAAMALAGADPVAPAQVTSLLVSAILDMPRTDSLFEASDHGLEEWNASRIGAGYRAAGRPEFPTSARDHFFPWFTLRPSHHAIRSLCRTDRAHLIEAMPALLHVLRKDDRKGASFSHMTEPVLRYLFGGENAGMADRQLSEMQRQALTEFYDNPATWTTKDAAQELVLSQLRLPPAREESRDKWRRLLDH
jgi:hypothetical protein